MVRILLACALYHAFIDAIGAVHDRNALFDGFPGSLPANVYRAAWLIASVVLWLAAEKRERSGSQPPVEGTAAESGTGQP